MSTRPENGQADKAAQDAKQHADALAGKAGQEAARVAETAKGAGKQRAEQEFERGKQVAEEHVGAVQNALGDAASRLEDEGHPFASYATELSGQLSSLSDRIENSSFDELVRDGRRVARDNPGLFMLGAVAVGFVASRFLKASERHDERDYVQMDSFDDDDDDRHERYLAESGNSDVPYRRAPVPPVTPVPRDSAAVRPATTGTATPAIVPPTTTTKL